MACRDPTRLIPFSPWRLRLMRNRTAGRVVPSWIAKMATDVFGAAGPTIFLGEIV